MHSRPFRCTEVGTKRLRRNFCITSYDLQTASKQTVISVTRNTHTWQNISPLHAIQKTRLCLWHVFTNPNGFCSKILFYTPPVFPSCWQHCSTLVLPLQCCSGSLFFSNCHCNICEACTAGVICLGKPQEPFTDFIITIVICYRHRHSFHIANGRCSSPLLQRSGMLFEHVNYFIIDRFPLKRAGERG